MTIETQRNNLATQKLQEKTFFFEKTVYLMDTNAEGNVYFARYFDWQGMAREEFFSANVPDHLEILKSGTRLITVNAWMDYKKAAYLFDKIIIQVQTSELRKMSLGLDFTFRNKANNEILGFGGEKLAFSDVGGSLIPVPNSIAANARYFLTETPHIERGITHTVRDE